MSVKSNNTTLWTAHVIAGLFLIVLLGLHMFGMHLNDLFRFESLNPAGGSPIDWANLIARAQEVSMTIFYICFLGLALYHGFYGLRNILFELNPSEGLATFISRGLLVIGIILFGFGTWAAIAAFGLARASL